MIEKKSVVGKRVAMVLAVSAASLSLVGVSQAIQPAPAEASTGDITMAGFGQHVVPPGTNGDTWDSTWLSNGDVLMQHNDGTGFGSGTNVHDRIVNVAGTPNDPSSLSGTNLNPGTLGTTLPNHYSSTVYEVDGALYTIENYSNQTPGHFTFGNAALMKSTDGGANWVNIEGGTNAMTANDLADSTFPNAVWGSINFVKYGEGGTAPNVDNAQQYVYLSNADGSNSGSESYYLARIKRSDLEAWSTTFDKTKIEYYIGGDGSQNSAWSTDIDDATAIYSNSDRVSPTNIVYNSQLGRYIATPFNSDAFASPQIPSSIRVLQADHPWGPWTDVLDENMQVKEGDNLTWSFLTQAYTSASGQQMWMTSSGQSPYGLQFVPVYLTTQPAQTLQAESAQLTGTNSATTTAGYTGSGYATGLNTVGDSVQFHPTVSTAGAYLINLRYHTTAPESLSWLVNGRQQAPLPIGDSSTVYSTWTTLSLFAWLNAGSNDLSFQVSSGDSGSVDLDNLALALYSTTPGSLPGATPPVAPNVDDADSGITYSGHWSANGTTATGYYDNTMHFSNTAGDYAQYSFTGTSVQFFGAKNDDNGKDDIYIDGTLKATIDRYSPTYDKQQLLYSASGLSNGSHTIKVVVDSSKNSASSDYYTDVDGFFVPLQASIDDTSSAASYHGTWASNGTTSTGYYDNTMHYSNTPGDYAQFTFTGTSIAYFGARNNDNGKDDIYVDGTLEATIDRYSPTYDKQQQLFAMNGLGSGTHTLKIVVRSDRNPASSNYYTDVDGFAVS